MYKPINNIYVINNSVTSPILSKFVMAFNEINFKYLTVVTIFEQYGRLLLLLLQYHLFLVRLHGHQERI